MFIKRDSTGKIIELTLEPAEGREHADPADPEVRAFISNAYPDLSTENQLEQSDIASVRILEDLVDVLIDKGTLLFTDLPDHAQKRLLERKMLRRIMRKERGLPDEDDGFILSDDKIF